MRKLGLLTCGLVSWCASTVAAFTMPPFSVLVEGPIENAQSFAVPPLPAGVWTSLTMSVDWSTPDDAWSREAAFFLADGPISTASFVWAAPGRAPNGFSNPAPTTLFWNTFLDFPYNPAVDPPLTLTVAQTFPGVSANWNNVTLSFGTALPAPPSPAAVVTVPGSLSRPIGPSQVLWYQLEHDGGYLEINTFGSQLTPNISSIANDTLLAVYSQTGALVAFDDDFDPEQGLFTSRIELPPGSLPAGTYYLAVTGWNALFNRNFDITAVSISQGTIMLNTVIPEPTLLLPVASMILLMGRRRGGSVNPPADGRRGTAPGSGYTAPPPGAADDRPAGLA